jgi:hypothetical protein
MARAPLRSGTRETFRLEKLEENRLVFELEKLKPGSKYKGGNNWLLFKKKRKGE